MTDADLEILAEGFAELLLVVRKNASAKAVDAFALLLETVNRLDARVAAIEERGVAYKGIWQAAGAYKRGDLVTYDGSIFHANDATRAKPGNGSASWTLCVKRGADGRDVDRPHVRTGVRAAPTGMRR